MEHEKSNPLISAAVTRNERYRDRTRALGALMAAATAAIAAAVVSGADLPDTLVFKLLATSTLALLVLATSIYIAASIVHARESPEKSNVWKKILRPWVVHGSRDFLQDSAASLLIRIKNLIDIGNFVAVAAAVTLLASAATVLFYEEPSVPVIVGVMGNPISVPACGELRGEVNGTMSINDYASSESYARLIIDKSLCSPAAPGELEVSFERSGNSITKLLDNE